MGTTRVVGIHRPFVPTGLRPSASSKGFLPFMTIEMGLKVPGSLLSSWLYYLDDARKMNGFTDPETTEVLLLLTIPLPERVNILLLSSSSKASN